MIGFIKLIKRWLGVGMSNESWTNPLMFNNSPQFTSVYIWHGTAQTLNGEAVFNLTDSESLPLLRGIARAVPSAHFATANPAEIPRVAISEIAQDLKSIKVIAANNNGWVPDNTRIDIFVEGW
jgi:hypothetical protein